MKNGFLLGLTVGGITTAVALSSKSTKAPTSLLKKFKYNSRGRLRFALQ